MTRKQVTIVLGMAAVLVIGCFGGRSFKSSMEPTANRGGSEGKPIAAISLGKQATPPPPPSTGAKAAPPKSKAALTPLPPPGAPLKQTFDELKARADVGDVEAASRLYHDLSTCRGAGATIRNNTISAERNLDLSNLQSSPDAQQIPVESARRLLDEAKKLKDLCADVNRGMLDALSAVTLEAAQLGDPNARDCYVNRGPLANPRAMVDDPSSVEIYREQTPALIDSAVAAGDWKMIDMLQYAYGPSGTNLIAGLVGADPIQHYRYLKLFRLGASGSRITDLDRELAYASQQLDSQQRADSDAWAQTTQQAYFKGASTDAAPSGWNACAIPRE